MVQAVSDPSVRGSVRLLFLGAGALFLITVLLGIANAVMGDYPRGQVLAHFHSGTIGWVSLSVIATTVWAFTGERAVSDAYRRNVRVLAWAGVVAVAGYVAGFYLFFNDLGPAWLLPLFGIPAAAVIVGGFVVAATQVRKLDVVTTPHLLLWGALLVASLGATMGVLVGLAYSGAVDVFPDAEGADRVGAHAGPMDMYLALAFGAVAELLVLAPTGRWSKAGMTQMVLGVASGFLASAALFLGIGPLVPVALLLFLVAFGFFFARVGWHLVRVDPTERTALWWGLLAFPFYIGLFVYLVGNYFSKGLEPPHVLEVVFVHTTFVAMASNLVFAVQSHFAHGRTMPRAAAVGSWLMNAGFLSFLAGEVGAGLPHGAYLMALGVLMTLWLVWNGVRAVDGDGGSGGGGAEAAST